MINAVKDDSNNITKEYFNNNNNIALKVTLTPLTLSEKAKSIDINIGNGGPRIHKIKLI